MDRFTTKQLDETYHIYDLGIIHEINCCDENDKNWFSLYEGEAIDKLGQYEDTGLTPQEIEQMKARMPLHQWAGESPDKMSIFGVTVSKIMELAEAEKQKINYTEIAKKLWTYICIIDDEKATYEELADAIGLTDDELAYCRRLER